MTKTLTILLAASLMIASCGWRDSRVNPSNWGRSQTEAVPTAIDPESAEAVNTLIPAKRNNLLRRPEAVDTSFLIANVTKLQVDRTPSGAIILAEGVASRQGAFAAELRPTDPELAAEDGILKLEFRVLYPLDNTPVGSERSRKIVEAFSVSNQDLNGIRLIRVVGSNNALETRRR